MAALDFPGPPLTNGQVFTGGNGVQYVWNGTIWLASSMASQASDTPPANPQTNQLWFNSSLGQLFIYYTDANSSQWVPANPTPSGVPVGGGIVREVTLASPAATIDLFSLGVKTVELIFALTPTAASADVRLQFAAGSTINTSATYDLQSTYQLSTVPGTFYGQFLVAGTSFPIAQGTLINAPVVGKVTYPDIAITRGFGEANYSQTAGQYLLMREGLIGPTGGGNGFRLSVSTGNFAAGSFVRVIGWQ